MSDLRDAADDVSDLIECDDVRHDVCNDFNGFDDEGDDRQGTAKARERDEGGRSTADSEVRVKCDGSGARRLRRKCGIRR